MIASIRSSKFWEWREWGFGLGNFFFFFFARVFQRWRQSALLGRRWTKGPVVCLTAYFNWVYFIFPRFPIPPEQFLPLHVTYGYFNSLFLS